MGPVDEALGIPILVKRATVYVTGLGIVGSAIDEYSDDLPNIHLPNPEIDLPGPELLKADLLA